MSEWISVEKQLPDFAKDVLTIYHYKDECVAYRSDSAHHSRVPWISSYDRTVLCHAPTHWMPLPKPPEEPKDEE